MIFNVYDIYWVLSLRAPLPGFIYATGQEFTRVLVEYGLESSFFYSKSTFESLYLSTSLMGRTRYTNPRVPEGHTLVSSPRDSIRVADSGWVSKTSNLWLVQSSTFSIFDFFKLRLFQTSASYIFDFKCNGQNRRVLESALPMGVNVESIDSKFSLSFFSKYFFIGCATSAPDGSSPRVYVRILVAGHRLKLHYSNKFVSCWRTWLFCRLL
jgi:hypothetical protein